MIPTPGRREGSTAAAQRVAARHRMRQRAIIPKSLPTPDLGRYRGSGKTDRGDGPRFDHSWEFRTWVDCHFRGHRFEEPFLLVLMPEVNERGGSPEWDPGLTLLTRESVVLDHP